MKIKGPLRVERGIDRQTLNSDFMRLKKYTVVDDPKLLPSDQLSMSKNPDHRITGFVWKETIFDSYAPNYHFKFDGELQTKDSISDECYRTTIECQQTFLLKNLRNKVSDRMGSGQTRNVLVNLSEMIHKKELCDEKFAQRLNNHSMLIESIVAIYPKSNAIPRGNKKGKKGLTWSTYMADDMEAVYWRRGMVEFKPLPDAKDEKEEDSSEGEQSSEDEDDDNRGKHQTASDNHKGSLPSKLLAMATKNISSIGLAVSSILLSPGILPIVIGSLLTVFLVPIDKRVKENQKKYRKTISKLLKMYTRQLRLAIGSDVSNDDFHKMHQDLQKAIGDRLIRDPQDREHFTNAVNCKYNEISSERWRAEILDMIFNQFYATLLFFLHLVSRLISKVISMTGKERIAQGNVVTIHVSLLSFCFFAEFFLQVFFLRFLSSPFRFASSVCFVSLIMWSLHFFQPHFISVANNIANVSGRIMILIEEAAADENPSMNTPKRIAVLLFLFGVLRLAARFLISISNLKSIFTVFAKIFKPFIIFERAFANLATFAKLINAFSFMLAVLIVVFVIELLTKHLTLTRWLNTPIVYGISIVGLCDALWEKMNDILGTLQLSW